MLKVVRFITKPATEWPYLQTYVVVEVDSNATHNPAALLKEDAGKLVYAVDEDSLENQWVRTLSPSRSEVGLRLANGVCQTELREVLERKLWVVFPE